MDAQLKAKWIEALRSGEYAQGTGKLYNDTYEQHCCLGVLCRVAGLRLKDTGNGVVGVPFGEDDYKPIYDLLGDDARASDLWRRNDGNNERQHSFPEIADYIEANL